MHDVLAGKGQVALKVVRFPKTHDLPLSTYLPVVFAQSAFAHWLRPLTLPIDFAHYCCLPIDFAHQLCRYERQIKELKAELTMRDSLAGRGQVNYSDLTDAEVSDLKVLVSSFLEGSASVEQLPSQTLKQVKETYRQMQLAYQASKSNQVSI